jgi:CelD/BcsL family acetyltransferase involved in cellulose biosynthesis
MPEHTVFQTYGYQRLWWRHFGAASKLFVVLILREGRVCGIAPLQIRTVKFHGRFCRELAFIGSRWEVDRPVFLVPQERPLVLRALAGFLVRQRAAWDIANFYEQQELEAIEAGFIAAGCLTTRERDSDCAYLDTATAGWEALLAAKSQKFRKNLKAAGKKLRELGKLDYRVIRTPAEVREQLEVYRTIEARSWKSAEEVGVSRSDAYFAFYLELAELFAPRGAFVVRMLTVDGRAVAGTFGLEHDGTYYSLQIAHDKEFDRCSPGTYLEAVEIEECFEGPFREYEFLGGFLNNKARWTSTFRHTTQLHVLRRTPFLVVIHAVFYRLKPWVKELIRPYMKSWHQNG